MTASGDPTCAQFLADDGAVLLMHHTGLVEQTEAFKEAAAANGSTDRVQQHMRVAVRFETGARRYQWVNTSLLVSADRLLGTGSIEYVIHRTDLRNRPRRVARASDSHACQKGWRTRPRVAGHDRIRLGLAAVGSRNSWR